MWGMIAPWIVWMEVCGVLASGTSGPSRQEMSMSRQWVESHLKKGSGLLLPFSFKLEGASSSEFMAGWALEEEKQDLDENRIQRVLSWTDPKTGLEARVEAMEYRDFPAVEWTVFFKNGGSSESPILSEVQALDSAVDCGKDGAILLHHALGDDCTPNSYKPLDAGLEPGSDLSFAPTGGRPTQVAFPYFNLEWSGQGVIMAIGWPGQWAARFKRDKGRGVRIQAGQELTHFSLLPGEEVRTPLIVLQFWKKDRLASQNTWRRWMRAHNLPRTGDGHLPPVILSSCSGGFFPGLKCNEADELKFIDTYLGERIPLNMWWMDAGWYPCGDAGWPQVGTWEPDPERFPRGIKAVSDHAHAKGLKLILWFEPERVTPGTWLEQKHPEWLLGEKGGTQLLNLGDPQARQWLTDHVDALLTAQGIDLYRQDFNMDPLGYWRGHDAPDRQGITEIRHVEGYLAYWDELRRRHPDLLLDSCASGGRRNDLETLRRAVPLLRSDYQSFQGDPGYAPGNQCHTYGLSFWLPYYGQGAYYNDRELEYAVRSHFCPAFGFCWDVRKEGVDWNRFRKLTEDWKATSRAQLLGDFYPLSPYSLANDVWLAWQFHCPDLEEGVVQAFRRDGCPTEAARYQLRGLDPKALYILLDLDTQETAEVSGRELTKAGLSIRVEDQPGSAIITYRKR